MKIAAIDSLHADAGWRVFSFLKITTDEGIVGWSEYNESYGSPGLTAVIEALCKRRVVGADPMRHERTSAELYAMTRQAPEGIAQQAIARPPIARLAQMLTPGIRSAVTGSTVRAISANASRAVTPRNRSTMTTATAPVRVLRSTDSYHHFSSPALITIFHHPVFCCSRHQRFSHPEFPPSETISISASGIGGYSREMPRVR